MRFWRTFGIVAALVLTTSGCSLYGWGRNEVGQLGDGTTTFRPAPVAAAPDLDFIKVEVAYYHSCGIDRDHALYCWGNNAMGELGIGTSGDSTSVPTRVGTETGWTDVGAGGHSTSQSFTCGIRSGSLFCWGFNQDGELGVGDTTNRSTPTRVGTDSDWTHVTGGHGFACGTRAGGTLFCWGSGYLGDGTVGTHLAPVEIASGSKWKLVVAGTSHTCGIRGDGRLFCWGENYAGQIGDGTMGLSIRRLTPKVVGHATDWTALGLGTAHTCGIRGGALYCWGSNWAGELGNGTTTTYPFGDPHPTQVGTATDWTFIAGSDSDSCGIRSPGNLFCWGFLPSATGEAKRLVPGQEPLDNWTSISMGDRDRLGLRYTG